MFHDRHGPSARQARRRDSPAFRAIQGVRSLQRETDRLFEDVTPAFAGRSLLDIKCKMDLPETEDGPELAIEVKAVA